MLAVGFMEFGGPDVLRLIEREVPIAKSGEVVVRVAASTVNPTDIMMRDGRQAASMATLVPPYIAGVEFAGIVHSVSQSVDDSSSAFAVAQPVMGIVNARRPEGGAHAQYLCVPAASLAALDPSVDLAQAATVPMNGMTAKMAVEALELHAGSSILITGGAGAAGGYAIQLAKRMGHQVIADAKESDIDLLRQLGADHVVPRGDAMTAAVRRLFPDGVDGLIDTALLADRAAALVREGGPALTLRKAHPINDPRVRARYINVIDQATNAAALGWLAQLLRDGTLTPRVAIRLPMSEAARAHGLVEQGGFVLLTS
jgi:NADPH:quinone reductase